MKKRIKQLSLALGLLSSSIASAQVTWYFGKSGLKFTNNTIASTPLPATDYSSHEPSSVLMDGNNNVICYTNGSDIWNGSNVNQTPLSADRIWSEVSCTQGVVIVPIPGNIGKAFVFTVTDWQNLGNTPSQSLNGLRASVINYVNNGTTTAPNYSITFSEFHVNITGGSGLMSERIVVTSDASDGYWVVVHGGGNGSNLAEKDNFYSFHVSCNTTTTAQLAATKVKSDMSGAGLTSHICSDSPNFNNDASGQMKFNRAGTRLACVIPHRSTNQQYNPAVQLFNFDKNTGIFSNPVEYGLGFINTGDERLRDGEAYGLEFSYLGNYIYVTSTNLYYNIKRQTMTSRIYRYPIGATGPPTGPKQLVAYSPITSSSGTLFGALLMGPDQRIYAAQNDRSGSSNTLAYVNSTDAATPGLGTITIPGGLVNDGLPNVCPEKSPTVLTVSGPSATCKGIAPTFTLGTSGVVPAYHYCAVYGSNANGDPINASGVIQGNSAQSYYYKEIKSWWTAGTPPASVTVPELATVAQCGQYYTIILATNDQCQGPNHIWKRFTTSIKCSDPAFSYNVDISNTSYFTVTATPVDASTWAYNSGYGYAWRVQGIATSDPNSAERFIINNPSQWITSTLPLPPTTFSGFYDNPAAPYSGYPSITSSSPTVGRFIYGRFYKITRGTWDAFCPGKSWYIVVGPPPHRTTDGSEPQTVQILEEGYTTLDNSMITGVEELGSLDDSFVVYPNPSNGFFNIVLNNEKVASMEVYDMTGRVVKRDKLTEGKNELDLSGFTKGVYLIKVNGDMQQMKKIILE
jgi:hypothetical protein